MDCNTPNSQSQPQCVALIAPAWPPGATPNGIVTYTSQLLPAFRELGVHSVVLAWEMLGVPRDNRLTESNGDVVDIASFRLQPGILGKVLSRTGRLLGHSRLSEAEMMIDRAVRSAVGRFAIQVLEMEEAFGFASRIVDLGLLPIVVRLHGPWFLNGEALGAKQDSKFAERVKKEGEAIAKAAGVTAPSQDVLDRTRAFYDLPLEHAQVIPCPVDRSSEEPLWNIANCDRNRIVFVGRFDLHKGADVMIDAFARVAARHPSLQLDFVGPDRGIPDGAHGLIQLGQYLDRHVPDQAIRNRIHVHGQKSPHEATELRRRGFLTVVPSRYETFGYTAVEAMSLGCPVIAANAGGLAESIRDGQTGLLFRSKDPESLAAQIDGVLHSPEMAVRLGEAARVHIEQRFNSLAIAKQTLDFYALACRRWLEQSGKNLMAGKTRPVQTG